MSETAYQLTFDGDTLRYTPPDSLGWEVHKSQIMLIGESTYGGRTLGNVPSLCLADRTGKCCFAPIAAPGFSVAVAGLGRALKTELKFTGNKTRACESRVVAPHIHRDKPMFEFESVPAQGMIGRLLGSRVVVQNLTEEMREVVLSNARRAAQAQRPPAPPARLVTPAASGQRRAEPSAQQQHQPANELLERHAYHTPTYTTRS